MWFIILPPIYFINAACESIDDETLKDNVIKYRYKESHKIESKKQRLKIEIKMEKAIVVEYIIAFSMF